MNSTVKDPLLPNIVSQKVEKRIPQGWMIPQYLTLKSKLPKYRLKKSSIPQYRKPPCPPPPGKRYSSKLSALHEKIPHTGNARLYRLQQLRCLRDSITDVSFPPFRILHQNVTSVRVLTTTTTLLALSSTRRFQYQNNDK